MEQITLITTTTYSSSATRSKFKRLCIGHEEVPVGGRTISQCLEEMVQQGWDLTATRAIADLHGIVCEYDFQRLRTLVGHYRGKHKVKPQRRLHCLTGDYDVGCTPNRFARSGASG